MADTADSSAGVQAALTIYQWVQGADSDDDFLLSIQSLLGSPLSLVQLQHLRDRLQRDGDFLARQAPVVARWRTRIESPTPLEEDEAQALIREFFEGFDHALLYDHGVTANSTLIRRGEVSDSDTRFAGNMPCWTLHLTVAGRGLFLNDTMEQEVNTGAMMLMRPTAAHHYGLHPMASDWEHLWALFQPRAHWSELLDWTALDEDIVYLALPDDAAHLQIKTLFRELIALGREDTAYQDDLQYNKLEEMLIRARTYSVEQARNPLDSRIQTACDLMQARLNASFNIDEIANACNLSTSRLSHLFKQQIGLGPKTWINNLRLQHARKLLINSKESVNAIGARVGYENPSHFTKYFKKNMGCSPRQFRQSFKP
jgi:AraC family transcriptional regulator of arabinose operon